MIAQTGGTLVHPYNAPDVMAGQGTMALELLAQVSELEGAPTLDAIVVPVSGCGMVSGIAVAAKTLHPGLKVIAAEPRGANDQADVAESLSAGELIGPASSGTALPPIPAPATICDGLRGHMKDLTWAVVEEWVDGAVAVSDTEVVEAMGLVYERAKLVVEPSAGVGLAAVLNPSFREAVGPEAKNIGVILCGGNIDLARFIELMDSDVAMQELQEAGIAPV